MHYKLGLLCGLLAALAALLATAATAAAPPTVDVKVIQDAGMSPRTATNGGASVLPTTRTVAHWFGTSLDPHNGVTYGYNMVGADPNHCSGTACSTTVTVDVVPLIVNVGGRTFSGTNVLNAALGSPQFTNNDYTTTTAATSATGGKGPGGALSAENTNVQLEDATMRSQFNKVGASPYHVILSPVVHPAVTIDVPQNQGTILQSVRGVVFADVDIGWWSSQLQNLMNSLGYVEPTHLVQFLTDT